MEQMKADLAGGQERTSDFVGSGSSTGVAYGLFKTGRFFFFSSRRRKDGETPGPPVL